MSNDRLPARQPAQGLGFDPAAPSPLVARGLERLERSMAVSTPIARPEVLWRLGRLAENIDVLETAPGLVVLDTWVAKADLRLVVLDAGTGEVRWSRTRAQRSERIVVGCGDILCLADRCTNDRQGQCPARATITALDAGKGEIRWSRPGHIVDWHPNQDKTVFAHRDTWLEALDPVSGEPVWRLPVTGQPTIRIDGGQTFVNDRLSLTCLDNATGEIVWTRTPGGFDCFHAADDSVVLADNPDRASTSGLDRRTGAELWRIEDSGYRFGNRYAPRALLGGIVFLRDSYAGTLFAMDGQSFRERWRLSGQDKDVTVYPWGADALAVLGRSPEAGGPWVRIVRTADGALLWSGPAGAEPYLFDAPDYVTVEPNLGLVAWVTPDGRVEGEAPATGGKRWSFDPGVADGIASPDRTIASGETRFVECFPEPRYPGVFRGMDILDTHAVLGRDLLVRSEFGFHLVDARDGTPRWGFTGVPSMSREWNVYDFPPAMHRLADGHLLLTAGGELVCLRSP